jgi:S1-C subfamily serine protease
MLRGVRGGRHLLRGAHLAWIAVLAALGCALPGARGSGSAVEVPVVLWFDDYKEVLSGTGRQYDFLQGTPLDLVSQVGPVRCVGQANTRIVPPDAEPPHRCDGVRGDATLTCNDGRTFQLEWLSGETCGSGYGKGLDAQGHGFHLAYGGSPQRAEAIVREALLELAGRPPLPSPSATQTAALPSVSTGTAFFATWEGMLVTNHHVIGQAQRVHVKLDDGDLLEARVVATDQANDLAVLQVDAIREPLPIRAHPALVKGQEVLTLGYPLVALQGQESKATFGHVNALSGYQGDVRFAQIDVPIQPGNSGGPLLDRRGHVVGVVTSMLHPMATLQIAGVVPQNVNYALKSEHARVLLERTRERDGVALTLEAGDSDAPERDLSELVTAIEGSVVLVVAQ